VLPNDPAASRYIISFGAELIEIQGQPWVRLVVVGQSFMLHQIRWAGGVGGVNKGWEGVLHFSAHYSTATCCRLPAVAGFRFKRGCWWPARATSRVWYVVCAASTQVGGG
jgi:hypothetical protein